MNGVIEGIIYGVVASIIAILFTSMWLGVAPHKKLADRFISARLRTRIRKDYLGEFEAKKSGAWGSILYYFRNDQTYPKTAFGAPFALLSDPAVELREFKAFLIPPLDNGRAKVTKEPLSTGMESLVAGISITWQEYFDAIGTKAKSARSENKQTIARRIVFIDKNLIDYVIADSENAIKLSGISKDGNLSIPIEIDDLGKFSQYAFRAAYHLLSIHRFNNTYIHDVETIYVDKSMVQSNQYYDFGLYNFSGARLVYMPHYLKDKTKTMVGDKVILDESRTQRELISEFESDFIILWERCKQVLREEERIRTDGDGWQASGRKFLQAHSASFFHEVYYVPLNKIFHDELYWKPRK